MYNFDPCNVLLAIATNIPVLLMTAFVLQGHICTCNASKCTSKVVKIQCFSVMTILIFSVSMQIRQQ